MNEEQASWLNKKENDTENLGTFENLVGELYIGWWVMIPSQ